MDNLWRYSLLEIFFILEVVRFVAGSIPYTESFWLIKNLRVVFREGLATSYCFADFLISF